MKKISVRKLQISVLLFLTVTLLFVWFIVLSQNRGHNLRVSFLDVGQGDAILIEAPNGNRVLIDGGDPSGKVLSELGSILPFYDRNISVIVATHPDQDHIGGLPEVFKRYAVQALFEPDLYSGNGVYEAMERNAEDGSVKKVVARGGTVIKLDKNTTLQILYPEKKTSPAGDTNAVSIVVKLTYGNETFLFTGDLPQEQEDYLVEKYGALLQSNVLKFGHHGSKTSNSREFLDAVHPEYGVISVGADNKYGHPSKEVLTLAQKDKIQILRTDTEGRIIFETDGVNLSLVK